MTIREAIRQLEMMATNMMGGVQDGNPVAVKNYDALDMAIDILRGMKPKEPCQRCNGTGSVSAFMIFFGKENQIEPCTDRCDKCNGTGRVENNYEY